MANNRKLILSGFIGVVILGSFLAGIFEPELRAQGGLPETMFSLRPAGGRELDPSQTYKTVIDRLNEDFVGELPSAKRLTYTAIRGLLNSLDDPYTRFLDPEEFRKLREENDGEFEGIGATLEGEPTQDGFIRIVRPIPGGPAEGAGVKRGDTILKVDNVSLKGRTVDEAVNLIRGKSGTVVRLTVRRTGEAKPLEIAITRRPVELPILEYRMLEGNIGYVSLLQFNEMSDKKLEMAVRELERKGMKGLIFDLRGNPGGLLNSAIDVSSRFIPSGKDVVIIEETDRRETKATNDRARFLAKWPFVVLVNRTSASASEIVSGAVKDNKTGQIVGTTTFGKGLVQTLMPLDGGAAVLITTAKYLTPSGRDINRTRAQRGGVEPDVFVDVTEEQFLRGEDPQLKKALSLLHEKTSYTPPAARPASGPAASR